jgi:hypothetical protein
MEGPVLWLDASLAQSIDADAGGFIRRWADRSSAGNEARQDSRESQPRLVANAIGGRPAVRFDGGDYLVVARSDHLNVRPGDSFTIAVVCNVDATNLGTLIGKGGGASSQRAYQFYVTPKNQGAIVYGAMQEAPRQSGPAVAMLACDGTQATVLRDGQTAMSFTVGKADSDADVLIGSRRLAADNSGTFYTLTGDIAEILVYDRLLSPTEIRDLGRHFAVKYSLKSTSVDPADARALETLLTEHDAATRLDAIAANVARAGPAAETAVQAVLERQPESASLVAELLLKLAEQNKLSNQLAAVAGQLAAHQDPFVRGMSDWALALKVGGENNGQLAKWPVAESPDWFRVWSERGANQTLETDWVQQAVAAGIHRDPAELLRSVDAMIVRVERMMTAFLASTDTTALGANVAQSLAGLQDVREAMAQESDNAPAALPEARRLWLQARRHLRDIVMADPALDIDRIVFVKQFAPHTVRNITRSYAWKHKPGGDICVLSDWKAGGAASGVLRGRLGPGYVWGLDLWWDADRVVFGYARQPNWPPAVNTADSVVEGTHVFQLRQQHEPLHLFEATFDDQLPTQLTNDPYWSDFEPTYCASGSILFASDRCGRSAECGNDTYDHTNPNLYMLSADRSTVLQWTDSKDIDRYPHSLDDGRIAYTHWEYQERHFLETHALWTARSDGTMSDALFKQHMRAPYGLRDTRSIPGSAKLVSIATGHHTFAFGPVVVVDPSQGMNNASGIAIVTPGVVPQEGPMAGQPVPEGGVADKGGLYQTPWALSETCFLVSYATARPNCTAPAGVDSNGFALYVIDVYGNRELIHRDPLLSCTMPIPLQPRRRPPLVPDVRTAGETRATCYVPDIYEGMPDVARGTIKFIRISQHVGWPFDQQRGQMDYIPGNAGSRQIGFPSWSPVRVIGTVPVESDGSACFQVPADTAVYFQALDENQMEIVRMRSFVSMKSGETRGCRGCHESQARAPAPRSSVAQAIQNPPQVPLPPPWGADKLLGYEWLIQPILDQHCVRCHGAERPDGGLDFTATRTAGDLFQSYHTLFGQRAGETSLGQPLVACSDRFSNADVTRPRQFGSHMSPLIRVLLDDDLHLQQVQLDPVQWLSLVTWVDANAPYFDRFLNKRPSGGGPPRREVEPDLQ